MHKYKYTLYSCMTGMMQASTCAHAGLEGLYLHVNNSMPHNVHLFDANQCIGGEKLQGFDAGLNDSAGKQKYKIWFHHFEDET